MSTPPKNVTGLATFTKNISTYKYEFLKNLYDTTVSINKTIIKKAIYYTPVDTGDLRKSFKQHVSIVGNKYIGVVTVGGADIKLPSNNPKKRPKKPIAYYALYVHEDLVTPHAPPTQAKFLERAIREVQGSITATFARNIKNYKAGTTPKPTMESETIAAKVNTATGIDKAKPIVKRPDHKPHGK